MVRGVVKELVMLWVGAVLRAPGILHWNKMSLCLMQKGIFLITIIAKKLEYNGRFLEVLRARCSSQYFSSKILSIISTYRVFHHMVYFNVNLRFLSITALLLYSIIYCALFYFINSNMDMYANRGLGYIILQFTMNDRSRWIISVHTVKLKNFRCTTLDLVSFRTCLPALHQCYKLSLW